MLLAGKGHCGGACIKRCRADFVTRTDTALNRPASADREHLLGLRSGATVNEVFSLPVVPSEFSCEPCTSEPIECGSKDSLKTPFIGARLRLGVALAVVAAMAMVAAGCSTKTSEKSAAVASTVVTEGGAAESTATESAVANGGAVTPATPADTSEPVAATPADDSAAAPEGPASAAANQIAGTDLVPVSFDFPDTARPIKEVDRPVADGTKRLALTVSGLTYHGVVCGFSIKGTRPESPVLIRMTGTKADGSGFDSGPISVAWTSTEPPKVSSGGADNNGWNFLSDANPNRSGPGWVVSLGGVTPAGAGSIPKTAACSLEPGVGTFSAANGPIGYWAGFARN